MSYFHEPVLLAEVLQYLHPCPGQFFIDCTYGGGSYSRALAERIAPKGKVLAIDADSLAINNAKKDKNIILIHDNFKNLHNIIKDHWPLSKQGRGFNGIVFDLGLSSAQLQDRSRGFSFQLDAPLNMLCDNESERGAKTIAIVNKYKEKEISDILFQYGGEKYSRKIAKQILVSRKEAAIKTTKQLVDIIGKAVPSSYKREKRHYATKTFQALRIATNNELDNIEKALPVAIEALSRGGRIAVISYHSLEDRAVKNIFKRETKDCLCPPEIPICRCGHKARLKIITKKPITPSALEINRNPRARSAKLRVAEKIN